MDVRMPDGTVVRGIPDGTPKDEIMRRYQARRQPPSMGAGEDVARTLLTTPNDFAAAALSAPRELASLVGQTGAATWGGALRGARSVLPESVGSYLDRPIEAIDQFRTRPDMQPGAFYDLASESLAFKPWDLVAPLPRHEPQTGAGEATRLGVGLAALAPAAISARAPVAAKKLAETTANTRKAIIESARDRRGGLTKRTMEPFTEEGAQREAGRILQDRATNPEAAIQSMGDYRPAVHGVRPTMAEASGDPGLAAFQRQGIQTGQGGAVISEQLNRNALAREQFLLSQETGTKNASALETLARRRLDKFNAGVEKIEGRSQDKISEAAQQIEDHAKRASKSIGNPRSPDLVGDDIRGVAQGLYDDMRSVVGQAYNAPELQDVVDVRVPDNVFRGIMGRADQFYGDFGGQMPPALQQAISDLSQPGQNTRSLANIDRRIADAGGELFSQGRIKEAAFARSLRQELGNYIQQAMPENMRAAYTKARNLRSRQGELFEEGQLSSVLSKNEYGRYELGSSRVADTLFETKNAVEAAKQLKASMGNERAGEAVKAWAANVFSSAIDENGKFNAKLFGRLRARHANLLMQFPEVAKSFQGISKARQTIDEYQDSLMNVAERVSMQGSRTRADYEKSSLGAFLSGKNPDDALAQIMRSDKSIGRLAQLKNQVKDTPEAAAGLRRGVLDYIRNRADTGQMDFQGNTVLSQKRLADSIKEYGPKLRMSGIFTEPQLKAMTSISDDIDRLTAAQSAGAQRGSDTAARLEARSAVSGLVSKIPGVGATVRGVISVYDALKAAQNLKSKEQIEGALIHAAQEPEFAALLMRRASPEAVEMATKKLLPPDRSGRLIPFGGSSAAQGDYIAPPVSSLAADNEEGDYSIYRSRYQR